MGTVIAQEAKHPQARASPARRHARPTGPISTGAGSSGSTPRTRGWPRAGKSPARRASTTRSSSRSRGRASFPASTRSKGAPKVGWYRRHFTVPTEFPAGDRVWLRFGAVDWRADVWVNGRKVAEHEGGYTPFEADISDAVDRDGENVVVVRAFDPTDPSLPTGKQVGWYTPSSGIWQTVWLEARPKAYIAGLPDHDRDRAGRGSRSRRRSPGSTRRSISSRLKSKDPSVERRSETFEPAEPPGEPQDRQVDDRGRARSRRQRRQALDSGDPNLYDVTLELKDDSGQGRSTRSRPTSAFARSAAASTATSRSSGSS